VRKERTGVVKTLLTILSFTLFASCGEENDGGDGNKSTGAEDYKEAVAQVAPAEDYKEVVDSFFDRHCYDCHDDETKKSGLDLLALTPDFSGHARVLHWTDIVDRIESGEMPPKKKKRPTAEEVSKMLAWVHPRLTKGDRELREVVQRRLNRIEYENTMHDLLGIDIPLKQLLPEDQELHGFDNNGAALAISAEHMMRYLTAARLAIDAAIVHRPRPEVKIWTVSSHREVERYLESGQYGYENERVIAYLSNKSQYSKISTRDKRVPERGRYRFSWEALSVKSDKPLVFSVNTSDFSKGAAAFATLDFYEAPLKPKRFEFEAVLGKKHAIQFFIHGLPTWITGPAKGNYPGVAFGPVTITGPLNDVWPPESHTRLLGKIDLETAGIPEAETLLSRFLPRAFRRPAQPDELKRYLGMTKEYLKQGRTFEDSLRVALVAALCSPNFLYMDETLHPLGRELHAHELATRLSYFLWSSMPDAELFRCAADDSLLQPAALSRQVERMLKDSRSEQFTRNFVGQWLRLREINETTPDRKLYGEYDELLQYSLIQESESFFQHLLDQNLSVVNCLDSNFTLLNERTARHYGIDGVDGVRLRKVALKPDSVRGGVLTQGAVLKVTANGTNTSPVLRGVWALENILGKTPRPPPPNIAGLEPDIRSAVTIREQLAKHRDIESCNVCHRFIDPPGFALESFDPIGKYREKYLRFVVNPKYAVEGWGKVQEGAEVDPSGKLTTGEAFAGIRDFKALLVADKDRFAKCLAEKILMYALGRELGYSDRPTVDAIVSATIADGYGLRTLLHQVIASQAFREK
jgi:mono/diheme cytochrome c family protein